MPPKMAKILHSLCQIFNCGNSKEIPRCNHLIRHIPLMLSSLYFKYSYFTVFLPKKLLKLATAYECSTY